MYFLNLKVAFFCRFPILLLHKKRWQKRNSLLLQGYQATYHVAELRMTFRHLAGKVSLQVAILRQSLQRTSFCKIPSTSISP